MLPDRLEQRLRDHLDVLGPAPRAELLRVLMLPDLERAERLGEFWSYPESRTFAELLIDCEEDRALRAVLVGMLWEDDGQSSTGSLGRTGSPRRTASRRSHIASRCASAHPPHVLRRSG